MCRDIDISRHGPVTHVQGSLEGSCGIYATINAISLLLNGEVDCEKLFEAIIRFIGPGLANVILNGMIGAKLEKKVLKPAILYLAENDIELRYKTVQATDLDDYWTIIQDHYEDNGNGSVIFSISGSNEHWSCASKITRRCIFLQDSSEWKQRLYRSRVTIGEPTKQQLHALLPDETFLLSVD